MNPEPHKDTLREANPNSPQHKAFAHDTPEEDAQKSYHTVLEQHVQHAKEELGRPALGLWLSSLSAGLDLGFGPLLMGVIGTLTIGVLPDTLRHVAMALAYTVGFVLVVIGRSALFTEQTTSAVLPVLAGRARIGNVLRLWSIVLCGNLIGGTFIAAFIGLLAPRLGIVDVAVLGEIAHDLMDHSGGLMLASAIVAGWLMGLLSWLVVASRDTISQIVIVILTSFVIGVSGLHHAIAGSIEVAMSMMAGVGPTLSEYALFVVWAVIGNAVGGVVFVALLKFGHVRASAG